MRSTVNKSFWNTACFGKLSKSTDNVICRCMVLDKNAWKILVVSYD